MTLHVEILYSNIPVRTESRVEFDLVWMEHYANANKKSMGLWILSELSLPEAFIMWLEHQGPHWNWLQGAPKSRKSLAHLQLQV